MCSCQCDASRALCASDRELHFHCDPARGGRRPGSAASARASMICAIPSRRECWSNARPSRDDVARHFVALSTYLGHADIRHTYWYLEATPDLMADIAAAARR